MNYTDYSMFAGFNISVIFFLKTFTQQHTLQILVLSHLEFNGFDNYNILIRYTACEGICTRSVMH